MISRGLYIGAIVDEFATIAEKIAMRNRLHLFDLTQHAEAYFQRILNISFGWSLINLNEERSNAPGLDLGDKNKGVGVQVTSSASAQKVIDTLKALTKEQKKDYHSKIIVFIAGKKQGSYSIKQSFMEDLPFTTKNIWDLNRVARRAMVLDIKQIQELHRHVTEEGVRIRFELEVPDEQGNYSTNNYDSWEPLAEPKVGDGTAFIAFAEKNGAELDDADKEKIRKAIHKLAHQLKRMPRLTREFLAMLIERREQGNPKRRHNWLGTWNLTAKLEREYRGPDLRAELDLLDHYDFAFVDFDDPGIQTSPEVFVRVSKNDDLSGFFVDFMEAKKLSVRDVIGRADLSAF